MHYIVVYWNIATFIELQYVKMKYSIALHYGIPQGIRVYHTELMLTKLISNLRGATQHQICSFFEHCSNGRWPPPLRFEHYGANFFKRVFWLKF